MELNKLTATQCNETRQSDEQKHEPKLVVPLSSRHLQQEQLYSGIRLKTRQNLIWLENYLKLEFLIVCS